MKLNGARFDRARLAGAEIATDGDATSLIIYLDLPVFALPGTDESVHWRAFRMPREEAERFLAELDAEEARQVSLSEMMAAAERRLASRWDALAERLGDNV